MEAGGLPPARDGIVAVGRVEPAEGRDHNKRLDEHETAVPPPDVTMVFHESLLPARVIPEIAPGLRALQERSRGMQRWSEVD